MVLSTQAEWIPSPVRLLCVKAGFLMLVLIGMFGVGLLPVEAQESVPTFPVAPSGSDPVSVSTPAIVPPPSTASQTVVTAAADLSTYRIRVGDSLDIKVYQEDDLNAVVQVDHEGGISLALIGRVSVLGLTPAEAQRIITDRYNADYLVNPQVLLAIKQLAPRRFSVIGEVSRPGVFEIPAREKVNLLQAIAMAGGYTRIADPTKVRIRRVTDKGEEIIPLNAKKLARETDEAVPVVMDNDTITVGLSFF
ncbi:MAG: polysaccharide export protein [Verrucomicrobiae bacterium]|nr:polysaccharide export protein [Verrucomicrobiae bacterium]